MGKRRRVREGEGDGSEGGETTSKKARTDTQQNHIDLKAPNSQNLKKKSKKNPKKMEDTSDNDASETQTHQEASISEQTSTKPAEKRKKKKNKNDMSVEQSEGGESKPEQQTPSKSEKRKKKKSKKHLSEQSINQSDAGDDADEESVKQEEDQSTKQSDNNQEEHSDNHQEEQSNNHQEEQSDNHQEEPSKSKKRRDKKKKQQQQQENEGTAGTNPPEQNKEEEPAAQRAALLYLQTWQHQVGWRFQKVRQVWLLKNMYDNKKINRKNFAILLAYLRGLQGNRRAELQTEIQKFLDDVTANPPELEGKAKKAMRIKTKRAKKILRTLQYPPTTEVKEKS